MGLDMCLEKEIYVGAMWKHRQVEGTVDLRSEGRRINVDVSKISTICEQVGSWRKANHIHNWFVTHVQKGEDDCGRYCIGQDKIAELLKVCRTVLSHRERAEELLPCASGFFFGDTAYDQWYFGDIEETVAILKEAQRDTSNGYYYSSSW